MWIPWAPGVYVRHNDATAVFKSALSEKNWQGRCYVWEEILFYNTFNESVVLDLHILKSGRKVQILQESSDRLIHCSQLYLLPIRQHYAREFNPWFCKSSNPSYPQGEIKTLTPA